MMRDHSWWLKPTIVFRVAILLSLLRVAIKIGVGMMVLSPLLIGDGVHNIGDAGVLMAASLVIWFMKNRSRGIYAADNLPALFQLAVAVSMGILAFWIAKDSIIGLCTPTTRSFDFSSLGMVALAISASIIISLTVSSYQIASGEPTLIASGQEMRGDAWIECSILAGFIGEYFFAKPWIEYAAGLIVVYLIGRTAWEMGMEAKNTLLQVSVGEQFETEIRSLVLSTYGIGEIVKLETYPVLRAVRIKVWVLAQGGAEANEDIKLALEERIREYASQHGYAQCKPDVFFALPKKDWHRVAYAVIDHGKHCFVARGLSEANVLRICAVENGAIVSGEDLPVPNNVGELLELIRSKHIRIYRAWSETKEIIAAVKGIGVSYVKTPTILPPE